MTIEISTSAFEFAHGRRPKGAGYWAFIFIFSNKNKGDLTEFAPGEMTYGDARKWAIKRAKELRAWYVQVGS